MLGSSSNILPRTAMTQFQTVAPDSFVTLRYRLCLADGTQAVSTFGMNPATLMLGTGQLNENLERCLIGMRIGERQEYLLEPEGAFGLRNPELVQRVALSSLPRELEEEVGSMVSFTDASGKQFAGTLIEKAESAEGVAVFDFNHPLAGRTVRFETEIVGIT